MDKASREVLDTASVAGNQIEISILGGERVVTKIKKLPDGSVLLLDQDVRLRPTQIENARHYGVGFCRSQ